jgi:tetratricopeptide (TPR) repeat protein
MKTISVDCPDLEAIAAYLDRRLSDEGERRKMAEHLASCESCYVIFTEAAQMRQSEAARPAVDEPAPSQWWTTRWAWSSAAGLAMAASLTLLVWTGTLPLPGSRGGELDGLVAAMGSERTIEPRLSGGFHYAPVRSAVRAGDPAGRRISPDVRIAAANLEKQVFAHRTPQTLKALGVAYLVMEDADRAVPLLEEAVAQLPNDAELLSDLSAAYFVRASRTNQSQDLTRALAMADRAVKADHLRSEAWFNRAFALERLGLKQEARDAWREYLAIDDASGWAAEARQHLTDLK